MNLSFAQLEEYVSRLPIDDRNYYIFEELIKQPYDLFRPIMEMLFDGTIVIEDLMQPEGTPPSSLAMQDADLAASRATYSAWDVSAQAITRRCAELASGRYAGAAIVSRDPSAAFAAADGSPGALYVPSPSGVVGSDSNAIAPNPIELARAGSLESAQKGIQEDYAAASQPDIG